MAEYTTSSSPGYCHKCASRNVTMTSVYGYPGTGPGGRGRLGDDGPGAGTKSECHACKHWWFTPLKRYT